MLSPGLAACSAMNHATSTALTASMNSTCANWCSWASEDYLRSVTCARSRLPIVEELASFIDIDCQVQTATDPFFATVSAAKKFWQAAQEVKNEIKIPALSNDGSHEDARLRLDQSARQLLRQALRLHRPPTANRPRRAASASASNVGCWLPSHNMVLTKSVGPRPCAT